MLELVAAGTLQGHTGPVVWGAWATVAGRPILATGGDDGTVRLWEVRAPQVEARRRTGYRSDDSAARDELDRTVEAASLAELVVARSVTPPLAVGVFGDWGSGKSVFLSLLAQQVQIAAGRGDDLSHDAVRQVWFNAWHYAETDLWASLVAEIFGQLAAPSADQPGVDAGTLQRQQSRLAAELIGRRKIAERLAVARSRRDALRRARAPRRWRVLPTDQREELSAAVTAVDPELAGQGAALYDAALGARPWLRVRLLQLRRIWRALPWGVWGALLLIVVGGIGAGIQLQPQISELLGGAGLLGFVGAVVAARTAIGDARETVTNSIEAIKKVSEAQRRQVDTAVTVADQEVTALERQLHDLTAAGALAGLASDRAAAGTYRRNLGLMTQIREDFHQMAALLARAEQDRHLRNTARSDPPTAPGDGAGAADDLLDAAGDMLPRIDRIVLYIDDLDRCPPDRVVAVLEAVHLLLAIPLFVVVVTVDPRWLQQAVDVHYQAMLHPTTHPTTPHSTGAGAGAGAGALVDPADPELWASSPAQYLEKIFQIVFTLPPLATAGYTRMLDDLTSLRVDQSDPTTDNPQPTPTPPDATTEARANPDLDPEIPWDATVALPAAPLLIRVDPYALREDERTLMRLLGPPLITTPRAVKRLTNSYGLLAAIQRQPATTTTKPDSEPPHAGGDTAEIVDGPAMVLLAALVGFAALGPALFTYLHHCATHNPPETWTAFLAQLEPVRSEDHQWSNPAAAHLTPVEAQTWRTLLAALRDVTRDADTAGIALPEPLAAWARWIVPVGRLSFPTGRIVTTLRPQRPPSAG